MGLVANFAGDDEPVNQVKTSAATRSQSGFVDCRLDRLLQDRMALNYQIDWLSIITDIQMRFHVTLYPRLSRKRRIRGLLDQFRAIRLSHSRNGNRQNRYAQECPVHCWHLGTNR
jgi:hypothetical protein